MLIIDDSESVRNRIKRTLVEREVFSKFYFAADGLEGFRQLRRHSIDLILCDLDMPGLDGFKFLRMLQSDPAKQTVPVILLTGHEDIDSKVKGLSAGASDYLTKPFEDMELIARVNVHLHLKRLRDELREKNRELEILARQDGLTGVANRRHLMERLEVEFARCARYRRPFSLMMLDLDHFKSINDTHGHQVGDVVLKEVARCLGEVLRTNDVLGRYGGEEFAVVLPETDVDAAVAVGQRCREAIADLKIPLEDEAVLRVTVSIGVAGQPDIRHCKSSDLVHAADAALYEAKRSGRNRLNAA